MNKIRVNMAVEPNDIQTLHCSQYDTEERKFSVDLHENGVGVSPSSISNQLVYKSFKGGTEQILPTNTSTPSTSPIIADIQYKDGLREDEEFLYRESPSDVDGYAKIKEIRGNTLVWNQIAKELTGADYSVDTGTATGTISGGVASITAIQSQARITSLLDYVPNHKYFVRVKAKASRSQRLQFQLSTGGGYYLQVMGTVGTSDTVLSYIMTPTTGSSASTGRWVAYSFVDSVSSDTFEYKSIEIFDLTKMGLDSLTASEFTSLFPLSYYAYDSGSLLSFNGSGIKTTGKNLLDVTISSSSGSGITYTNDNKVIKLSGATTGLFLIITGTVVLPKGSYALSGMTTNSNQATLQARLNNQNGTTIATDSGSGASFTLTEQTTLAICARIPNGQTLANDITVSPMVCFADADATYEPYEEHTLSLPISTYFPTGLKSAGSIYDELDETGYITRVGEVDLGNLSWSVQNAGLNIFVATLSTMKARPTYQENVFFTCSIYHPSAVQSSSMDNMGIRQSGGNLNEIWVRNTSYSDASTFKSAMSGVYLNYELATPLENYGVVDLGSLTWTYDSGNQYFYSSNIQTEIKKPTDNYGVANMVCSLYTPTYLNNMYGSLDKVMAISSSTGSLFISNRSYTDATAFKNAMSGIYLLYELNEPKGIQTASIVTNYGEMPLYNDNGELKADCIADVSQNSGFQIAKVKLKDENGEIYSNPFQIHTERSPQ